MCVCTASSTITCVLPIIKISESAHLVLSVSHKCIYHGYVCDVYSHMYTHLLSYVYTFTLICIHIYSHMYTYLRTPIYIYTSYVLITARPRQICLAPRDASGATRCLYTRICVYTYMCIHVYVYTRICVYTYMCIHVYVYTRICVYIYKHMYVYT